MYERDREREKDREKRRTCIERDRETYMYREGPREGPRGTREPRATVYSRPQRKCCDVRGVLRCAVCGVVRCGALWCAVVRCGALWCAVLRCAALCCAVLRCAALCCAVCGVVRCYCQCAVCSYVVV
jgi:hypothetical protein